MWELWTFMVSQVRFIANRAKDSGDRGDVSSDTLFIALMIVATIAVAGIIAAKLISKASSIEM